MNAARSLDDVPPHAPRPLRSHHPRPPQPLSRPRPSGAPAQGCPAGDARKNRRLASSQLMPPRSHTGRRRRGNGRAEGDTKQGRRLISGCVRGPPSRARATRRGAREGVLYDRTTSFLQPPTQRPTRTLCTTARSSPHPRRTPASRTRRWREAVPRALEIPVWRWRGRRRTGTSITIGR